jgi:hypothetical protein
VGFVNKLNFYVKGAVGSKWRNPYKLNKEGSNRESVLSGYEKHIRNSIELMASLWELSGKELGCWCDCDRGCERGKCEAFCQNEVPECEAFCHGDILIKLFKEKFGL